MNEPAAVASWREPRERDIVVTVTPRSGEPFTFALTQELERVAEYARRVRLLLALRHRVNADEAMRWLAEAEADDQRAIDLLARLDALGESNAARDHEF